MELFNHYISFPEFMLIIYGGGFLCIWLIASIICGAVDYDVYGSDAQSDSIIDRIKYIITKKKSYPALYNKLTPIGRSILIPIVLIWYYPYYLGVILGAAIIIISHNIRRVFVR